MALAEAPLPQEETAEAATATVIDLRDHVEQLDHAGFEAVLEALDEDGRLVHVERQPARDARFARTKEPLSPEVAKQLGVEQLWTCLLYTSPSPRDRG